MILEIPGKGRCVYAEKDYKLGDTVEICEYIRIPNEQIEILKKTVINDYRFGVDGDKGDALIILGNGSLYNHSNQPNMEPILQDDGTFGFVAIKEIKKGDELVFCYGYQLQNNYIGNTRVEAIVKKPAGKQD